MTGRDADDDRSPLHRVRDIAKMKGKRNDVDRKGCQKNRTVSSAVRSCGLAKALANLTKRRANAAAILEIGLRSGGAPWPSPLECRVGELLLVSDERDSEVTTDLVGHRFEISVCRGTASTAPVRALLQSECALPSRFTTTNIGPYSEETQAARDDGGREMLDGISRAVHEP